MEAYRDFARTADFTYAMEQSFNRDAMAHVTKSLPQEDMFFNMMALNNFGARLWDAQNAAAALMGAIQGVQGIRNAQNITELCTDEFGITAHALAFQYDNAEITAVGNSLGLDTARFPNLKLLPGKIEQVRDIVGKTDLVTSVRPCAGTGEVLDMVEEFRKPALILPCACREHMKRAIAAEALTPEYKFIQWDPTMAIALANTPIDGYNHELVKCLRTLEGEWHVNKGKSLDGGRAIG